MAGTTLLLALSAAVVVGWGVALLVMARRSEDERAGYYGETARADRLAADAQASALGGIADRTALGELAQLVIDLDRMAWRGVPVVGARRSPDGHSWTIAFQDGTELMAHTDDVAAMRRAAVLSHSEPLVVARVQPDGTAAVVVLWAPRHGPVRVALRA